MGSMDKITEDKIKSAANVVDVIGDFIQLRKRGVEYQGLCPFHADRSLGSFSVNPNKGMYKCFACGAGGDAIKFLMEYKDTKLSYGDALRYLAKKYSIYIDDGNNSDARWQNVKPAQPKAIIEQHKELLVIPREIVKQTMDARQPNIFIEWLTALPWNTAQQQRVQEVLWLYCVGRWNERVCFWQIDEKGQTHGGRLMRYLTGGKRDKDKVTGKPGWAHNQQGVREKLDLEHHEYRATLFGLHLLNRYPNAAVNIVESEKTALVCTIGFGDMEKNLWMACGGLEFLKVEALQPLISSGRRVWIWPDKDGVEKWRDKVGHMLNERVQLYTKFIDEWWQECDGPKADVADIIERQLRHPETAVRRTNENPKDEHHQIMEAIDEWKMAHDDEPFLGPEELIDPRVHEWRMKMSRVHSSGWYK